jgi:adenylate cyclase, class 2
MIEVEQKAKVSSFDDIKKALKSNKFKYKKTVVQEDRVFGHPQFLDKNHKIIEGGLIARIRTINQISVLEFKEILRKKGCLEINAPISSPKEGIKLLTKLGFTEAFTIHKTREIYQKNNINIALDKVKKLGLFIEVEKMVQTTKQISQAQQKCLTIINRLAPRGKIILQKYGDLMQNLINKKQ